MSANHPQFLYWDSVIEMEVLVCQFVKSVRLGNFDLYIQSLQVMMPWVFALDHGHYARWLPVRIFDMLKLESLQPHVYKEFQDGGFVVQRSSHRFSSMGLDQNHEQLNKEIKGDGGVHGLYNDPDALRKWMVAGPEIARLVSEFEESFRNEPSSYLHHDESLKKYCMKYSVHV